MNEQDIKSLVTRLQTLEDQAAITQIILTHPLAVDGGANEFWLSQWAEYAVIDRPVDKERHSGDMPTTYGKEGLRLEVNSPELNALRQSGMCHFGTAPRIQVNGDKASATNYLQLMVLDKASMAYKLMFLLINHWELRRANGQWKISKRVIRGVGQPEGLVLTTETMPK